MLNKFNMETIGPILNSLTPVGLISGLKCLDQTDAIRGLEPQLDKSLQLHGSRWDNTDLHQREIWPYANGSHNDRE